MMNLRDGWYVGLHRSTVSGISTLGYNYSNPTIPSAMTDESASGRKPFISLGSKVPATQ